MKKILKSLLQLWVTACEINKIITYSQSRKCPASEPAVVWKRTWNPAWFCVLSWIETIQWRNITVNLQTRLFSLSRFCEQNGIGRRPDAHKPNRYKRKMDKNDKDYFQPEQLKESVAGTWYIVVLDNFRNKNT